MNSMSHVDYTKKLRPYLPPEAFQPAWHKLVRLALHFAIIVSCYLTFRLTSSVLPNLLRAIVIGHSLVCIGFLSHELSHGAILRHRMFRYPIEAFFWGMNFIPATMWRRVHNHTHHVHANTPLDPDRPFIAAEKSFTTKVYSKLFYPQRLAIRVNPLVIFHLSGYIARNTLASFCSVRNKPRIVPACPRYSSSQRCNIVLEIGLILAWQAVVFHLVGNSWQKWMWASVVSYVFTSGLVMAYIFTNHFLNPIAETHDPLAHTTSVVVPRWMDRLHQHFSLHTEHHLFPSLNSDYYPIVADALRKEFPERYNVLPMAEAWRRLWRQNYFSPAINSFAKATDKPGEPENIT